MTRRVGAWVVGAVGGVGIASIVGARAVAQKLTAPLGLVTETPIFSEMQLLPIEDIVWGGCDVRRESLWSSARSLQRELGVPDEVLEPLRQDLESLESNLSPGFLYHSGPAIERLSDRPGGRAEGPRRAVADIQQALERFRHDNELTEVVVVNLASTEPAPLPHPDQATPEGLEKLLEGSEPHLRASTLYAMAAAHCGCAYINFTPSPAALLPGVRTLFARNGAPFAGSDAKTGETLVKSALAPMFRDRNLRILSWQGYNMLGDRDGEVLAAEENRQPKLESKDSLLSNILGYSPHSKVGIDFVPSLGDFKTAWDFIHFQGFLGVTMSLQFTWQGCDSALAAPLVIDLVRLLALAQSRGESGPQPHLACFFKSPIAAEERDLPAQMRRLESYLDTVRETP